MTYQDTKIGEYILLVVGKFGTLLKRKSIRCYRLTTRVQLIICIKIRPIDWIGGHRYICPDEDLRYHIRIGWISKARLVAEVTSVLDHQRWFCGSPERSIYASGNIRNAYYFAIIARLLKMLKNY